MKRNLLYALAALWASTAFAVDGVSVEAGRGTHNLNMMRLGVQWDAQTKWLSGRSWELARYWDLSFGGWNGGHGVVYDFGLTPVFRLERAGGTPYVEAAIGFHLLSDLDVGTGSEFSTRLQFGDHLGAGARFGLHREYDLSLRLQHLSNAGIRNPNPGVNFLQLRFQHHFR
jgi:hypothetical protein